MLPRLLPLLLLLAAVALLLHRPTHAADAKKPHPHQGVLEKYELKVPKIALDGAAQAKLKKGQPVKRQINSAGKSGGRGIVVQDVHAPSRVVMDRILDFGKYPKMVPNVAQCGNYATKKLRSGDFELKTRYLLSILGFKMEYFVRHVYRSSLLTVVWTLDYDRLSDFDDTAGIWSVVPLDGKNGEWSRVFYSIDLRIPSWVPSFAVNILNTQALTSATAWVKTQSEKVHQASVAAQAQVAQAHAAVAAAGAAAAASTATQGKKYGGGDLWEGFIEEFSDMIDTAKYAEKVQAKAEKRKQKRGGKKGGASVPGQHDDSRNLLVFGWVAILFYGLVQLWTTEEKKAKTSAK